MNRCNHQSSPLTNRSLRICSTSLPLLPDSFSLLPRFSSLHLLLNPSGPSSLSFSSLILETGFHSFYHTIPHSLSPLGIIFALSSQEQDHLTVNKTADRNCIRKISRDSASVLVAYQDETIHLFRRSLLSGSGRSSAPRETNPGYRNSDRCGRRNRPEYDHHMGEASCIGSCSPRCSTCPPSSS